MIHALLMLLSLTAPAESGYVWPLKLEPQLTSSFAEYRPGRFHAGIDLRTNGVGREVYAAADGYVSRVRCSPYGYGKAVYLQMADGNVAVYAHLSDFYPALAAFVRAEQHGAKSYTVDLQLAPSRFPIKRGQLIALSGQTGIGAPHLHYELRNAAEEPINPTLLGVHWPDSTRPAIRKIMIATKGMEGRINGDVLPVVLNVTKNEQGQYHTQAVHLAGVVGLGADVIDPGAGGYNLGIHELRLVAGEKEIFRMQHDLMSYTNHRNAAVAYHPQMKEDGRFLLLWRWPGNRCASYQQSPTDGWLSITPDISSLSVEAEDFQGNRVTVTIPVLPDEGVAPAVAAGQGVELTPLGTDLLITAHLPGRTANAPALQVNGDTGPAFSPMSENLYRALFSPKASGIYALETMQPDLKTASVNVAAWVQGAPAKTLELDEVRISAGPDAPYGTLILRAWTVDNPPGHPMSACSRAYELWPATTPLFEPVSVSIPLDSGIAPSRRISVYRHKGTSWSREDTTIEQGRAVFKTDELGVFMAMEDRDGPVFANVTPDEKYVAQTRRPQLKANVADAGSGIAEFAIYCGEQWLLAAYDPERGEIFWEQDEDLPSGPQEITFTLTDGAGNSRSFSRNMSIP